MSDKTQGLVPIQERTVVFYDDELTAVLVEVGQRSEIYVPMRPIVENLGLTWSPQLRRINRDPVLSEAATSVTVTVTESGQRGAMTCLPLKYLPGFLFGISVNRVKDAYREAVIRYQRECYDVLWEAFQEGRLTADPALSDLAAGDSPAAIAYRMASAVMRLARQQLLLETQQQEQAAQLVDHDERLERLEQMLPEPSRAISQSEAMQISQAVKAIAQALGKQTGRNEYGGVYGELYRRFEITSYKLLPAHRFEEAMAFLTEWHQNLTGDSPF